MDLVVDFFFPRRSPTPRDQLCAKSSARAASMPALLERSIRSLHRACIRRRLCCLPRRVLEKKKKKKKTAVKDAGSDKTNGNGEGGSEHFGSRAFDHSGAHARVVSAGVSTFDEVMHRLEEELRLSGFVVVSAAVSSASGSPATAAAAAGSEGTAASPFSPSPVCPPGSGRAATLTALRQEPSLALLARRPGLASLLPSVVCVFEAGGVGGDIVVSAAASAALCSALRLSEKRGQGDEEEEEVISTLRAADGALRAALDSVFRLPKNASPPGTYKWPPVRLPAVGGSAAEASRKAKEEAARKR